MSKLKIVHRPMTPRSSGLDKLLGLIFLTGLTVCQPVPTEPQHRADSRADHATPGRKYDTSSEPPKQRQKTLTWFLEAAKKGDAEAQNELGFRYFLGHEVPENYQESARSYRKAAEQGHPDAQYNLGSAHSMGMGVPEDDREAARWYRKAAERGHAGAQLSLGSSYEHGSGVPKDNIQAYDWYNLAAAQGDEMATLSKNHLRSKMPLPQVLEAQTLSQKLFERIESARLE